MNKIPDDEAIDDALGEAEIFVTIEEIAEYIRGGYADNPDLRLVDEVATAGRVLNMASRLPLANPVPSDVGFFLLAWAVDRLVEWDYEEGDEELDRITAAIDEIEKAHGLKDDEIFTPGDGPVEWEELNDKFVKRIDQLTIQRLLELGQVSMADLYEQDAEKFNERRKAGGQQLDAAVGLSAKDKARLMH